jgi:hypothetical protein
MRSWLDSFGSLLTAEQWTGAILGAVVSATFATVSVLFRALLSRRAICVALGKASHAETPCGMFVRSMQSPNGTYSSRDPHILPSVPPQPRHWHNIRGVYGMEDVIGLADIFNLLGKAGKTRNIVMRSLESDWDRWTEPSISVGGHFKAERALEVCEPKLVKLATPSFRLLSSGREFTVVDSRDYGVVYKGFHPATKIPAFVILGQAGLGTQSAASFFRDHAATLGRLYGSGGFAAIVVSDHLDGREGGQLVALDPRPHALRLLLNPVTTLRWRRALFSQATA